MKMRGHKHRQAFNSAVTGPFRSVEALMRALRMRWRGR